MIPPDQQAAISNLSLRLRHLEAQLAKINNQLSASDQDWHHNSGLTNNQLIEQQLL